MKKIFAASALGALVIASLNVACSKPAPTSQGSSPVTEEDRAPLFPIAQMIDRAKARAAWPDAGCGDLDGFLLPDADADQKTADGLGVAVGDLKPEQQALRTDGALVVQGGRIVYEKYVGPYEGHPEKRHCMWSATKSVTTGI